MIWRGVAGLSQTGPIGDVAGKGYVGACVLRDLAIGVVPCGNTGGTCHLRQASSGASGEVEHTSSIVPRRLAISTRAARMSLELHGAEGGAP